LCGYGGSGVMGDELRREKVMMKEKLIRKFWRGSVLEES